MNIQELVEVGEMLVKQNLDAIDIPQNNNIIMETLLNQVVDICAIMIIEYDTSKE
ncbi:MAG: hypothetical protein ABFC94_01095 [Syntrophomonas sp.]